ncbi:MAG: hypothetical protein KGJ88_13665 [Verrucomicrobiota bacterium]|nr:hypothetical protein [Verrucomicrobiota bacterium]
MKIQRSIFPIFAGAVLVVVTATAALAQDSTAPSTASALVPDLSYGATQVLQLSQAKMGDNVIVSYIENSAVAYNLQADQIVYLKQQGVSDTVINAMLNYHGPGTQAPQVATAPTASTSPTATVPPTVAYVQPASTVYIMPYQRYPSYDYDYCPAYSSAYCYDFYGWQPHASISVGLGDCWGGWHGGGFYEFRGGWH